MDRSVLEFVDNLLRKEAADRTGVNPVNPLYGNTTPQPTRSFGNAEPDGGYILRSAKDIRPLDPLANHYKQPAHTQFMEERFARNPEIDRNQGYVVPIGGDINKLHQFLNALDTNQYNFSAQGVAPLQSGHILNNPQYHIPAGRNPVTTRFSIHRPGRVPGHYEPDWPQTPLAQPVIYPNQIEGFDMSPGRAVQLGRNAAGISGVGDKQRYVPNVVLNKQLPPPGGF